MISVEQTQDFLLITKLNAVVQNWHCENYPEQFKPFDFDAISAAIKSMLESSTTTALIALNDGIPCGYVLCIENLRPENPFQYEHRFLQVDHIAVLPEFRHQGVASILIEKAEALAKQLNCTSLKLDHWEKNQRAATFFSKVGFDYFNHSMTKELDL